MSYKPNALAIESRPFSFSSASPLRLANLLAGSIVSRVVIEIVVPFNDPAATLQVGTVGTPGLFLGPTDNDPAVADQYSSEIVARILAPDQLILTINPGASVQGSGTVYFEAR